MREGTSIELAFRNEIKEIEYFHTMAERASNPMVRKLFKTLAREELELLGQIGELKQMTITGGKWVRLLHPDLEPLAEDTDSETEAPPPAFPPTDVNAADAAALRHSMSLASNGAKLFTLLAQKTKDPGEAQIFSRISTVEKEHMRSLSDALFFLENPPGWLGDRERSSLDGA